MMQQILPLVRPSQGIEGRGWSHVIGNQALTKAIASWCGCGCGGGGAGDGEGFLSAGGNDRYRTNIEQNKTWRSHNHNISNTCVDNSGKVSMQRPDTHMFNTHSWNMCLVHIHGMGGRMKIEVGKYDKTSRGYMPAIPKSSKTNLHQLQISNKTQWYQHLICLHMGWYMLMC